MKHWEIDYLLDLVNDETDRCKEMQSRGLKKSLHLSDLAELKETLLNTEYEEDLGSV